MEENQFIEVPITVEFYHGHGSLFIGTVKILKSAIPKDPNWVLSTGYKITDMIDGAIKDYELVEFGLIRNANKFEIKE